MLWRRHYDGKARGTAKQRFGDREFRSHEAQKALYHKMRDHVLHSEARELFYGPLERVLEVKKSPDTVHQLIKKVLETELERKQRSLSFAEVIRVGENEKLSLELLKDEFTASVPERSTTSRHYSDGAAIAPYAEYSGGGYRNLYPEGLETVQQFVSWMQEWHGKRIACLQELLVYADEIIRVHDYLV